MADDFDRFTPDREPLDLEDLSTLGAYDDAPPPNPRFVRALRGELMERAEALAQAPSRHGRQHASNNAMRSSLAAPPIGIQRRRWDRTLTFEVAAVAILLIALIGSITTRGRGGGGNETANGIINPPVVESEHTSWMYRQNAARTNVSADNGPISQPKVDWQFSIPTDDDGGYSIAAVADGVAVLVGANTGQLRGVSLETGTLLWSAQSGLTVPQGVAAAGDGYVYLAGWDGTESAIAAYDLTSGHQIWSATDGGGFASNPAFDGGKLYYLAADRSLQVLDGLTGEQIWSADVTADASEATPPAEDSLYGNVMNYFSVAVGEGIALVTGGDGTATAYDTQTHQEKWSFTTDGNALTTPVIADGAVYLPASLTDNTQRSDPDATGWAYRLDAATGEVVWKQETGSYADSWITGLIDGDLLLLNNKELLNTADGTPVGTLPVAEGDGRYGSWTFGNGTAYTVDDQGNVIGWSFDAASNTYNIAWQAYLAATSYESGNGLAIVGDRLLVQGPNRTLIMLGVDPSAPAVASAAGTPETIDLATISACTPPPPVDWENVSGEPGNTLDSDGAHLVNLDPNADEVPGTQIAAGDETLEYAPITDGSAQPWLPSDEVPTGTAASEDAIAGINKTIQAIKDCNQPGVDEDTTGFFSEDYYRRPWVQADIEQAQGYRLESMAISAGVFWIDDVQSVTQLPDGRVAVLGSPSFNGPDDFAMFVVFVQQGDNWVVDEAIRVGVGALMG